MAAKSRSAIYYKNHPEARAKKSRYDAKLNARPSQVNKREESNKMRARAKKRGTNVRGKDWDHHTKSFQPIHVNRGRRGEGGRVRFGNRK